MFFSSWEPLLEFLRFGIFFIGWLCVFQWRGRGNFHISFLSMWKGVLKIWMSCMWWCIHFQSDTSGCGCDHRCGRRRCVTLCPECQVEFNECAHWWDLNFWDLFSHWQKWNMKIFSSFLHKHIIVLWKRTQISRISKCLSRWDDDENLNEKKWNPPYWVSIFLCVSLFFSHLLSLSLCDVDG